MNLLIILGNLIFSQNNLYIFYLLYIENLSMKCEKKKKICLSY